MRRRLIDLCLNLCLAGVSVTGTVALMEGSARYLALRMPFALYPSPGNCMQRTALLNLEFQPSCTGSLSQTHFHTNSEGLRGEDIRDDGSVRILTIGDSCTWGWRVANDESYPARIQQLLDYRWGQGRYQVLNAGVPGTTSYQGVRLLSARGAQLRPDLVLVAYGFNDASPGGDIEELIARTAAMLPLLQLDDWLIVHSDAYNSVRWQIARRQQRAPEARVGLDKYVRNLTEIVKISRELGVEVLFVGFNAGPRYGRARAQVAKDLAIAHIPYRGPQMDLVHPTAEGYRDLAVEVVDRLTVDGVLEHRSNRTPRYRPPR